MWETSALKSPGTIPQADDVHKVGLQELKPCLEEVVEPLAVPHGG